MTTTSSWHSSSWAADSRLETLTKTVTVTERYVSQCMRVFVAIWHLSYCIGSYLLHTVTLYMLE